MTCPKCGSMLRGYLTIVMWACLPCDEFFTDVELRRSWVVSEEGTGA